MRVKRFFFVGSRPNHKTTNRFRSPARRPDRSGRRLQRVGQRYLDGNAPEPDATDSSNPGNSSSGGPGSGSDAPPESGASGPGALRVGSPRSVIKATVVVICINPPSSCLTMNTVFSHLLCRLSLRHATSSAVLCYSIFTNQNGSYI